MQAFLKQQLAERKAQNLYRQRVIHEAAQEPVLQTRNGEILNFCSNDYLGLAAHPVLQQALSKGAAAYGCGAGAAHLVNGHSRAHHDLEEALAVYTGRPRALLFSTGYMANLGTISALLDRQDAVFMDKWNHASLVDGALLSRAQLQRYPHNDIERLETQLSTSNARHKLIVTDGLFSMDGDVADLPALAKLAHQHNAWLMVDDAHGLGVLGTQGRGSLSQHGMSPHDVPVLVGTLGKAFGCFGAFVAGDEDLIEYLIQSSRSYIYTTALPPAVALAAQQALELSDNENWRRERLFLRIAEFRRGAEDLGLALMDSHSPIQGIILGDAASAMQASAALRELGLLITAIRPPTVPQGSARLRITLSASHSHAHVERLLSALAQVLPPAQS